MVPIWPQYPNQNKKPAKKAGSKMLNITISIEVGFKMVSHHQD